MGIFEDFARAKARWIELFLQLVDENDEFNWYVCTTPRRIRNWQDVALFAADAAHALRLSDLKFKTWLGLSYAIEGYARVV
jgi:hypothetical protein